jgi:hypothetical protein
MELRGGFFLFSGEVAEIPRKAWMSFVDALTNLLVTDWIA